MIPPYLVTMAEHLLGEKPSLRVPLTLVSTTGQAEEVHRLVQEAAPHLNFVLGIERGAWFFEVSRKATVKKVSHG